MTARVIDLAAHRAARRPVRVFDEQDGMTDLIRGDDGDALIDFVMAAGIGVPKMLAAALFLGDRGDVLHQTVGGHRVTFVLARGERNPRAVAAGWRWQVIRDAIENGVDPSAVELPPFFKSVTWGERPGVVVAL